MTITGSDSSKTGLTIAVLALPPPDRLLTACLLGGAFERLSGTTLLGFKELRAFSKEIFFVTMEVVPGLGGGVGGGGAP